MTFPCPAGCGRQRQQWQAVCSACWKRVPADIRDRLLAARRSKARHQEAKAAIDATTWLRAHPADQLASRVTGEAGRG